MDNQIRTGIKNKRVTGNKLVWEKWGDLRQSVNKVT